MNTQNQLKDPAKSLSDDRGKVYGDFREVSDVAQRLKGLLQRDPFNAVQKEAIDNICTKLARLRCGNPNDLDSWVDIAGYANLVVANITRE